MTDPRDITDKVRDAATEVTKKLMSEGKLIEAGFASLMIMAFPNAKPDPASEQFQQLRRFFYAGAQHLYGSMMNGFDDGTEETDDDMRKMELIHKELDAFVKEEVTRLNRGATRN